MWLSDLDREVSRGRVQTFGGGTEERVKVGERRSVTPSTSLPSCVFKCPCDSLNAGWSERLGGRTVLRALKHKNIK